MKYQSLCCSTVGGEQLHVMHISKEGQQGMPVLMLHGMVEDGRIFYHKSGKGLGSYLAQQGFDVYVADRRGVGGSKPQITALSTHGQTEAIVEDIPRLIEFVLQVSGKQKLVLVAHSWGGVMANAALLRNKGLIERVEAQVFFGSKRYVSALNFDRLLKIEIVWNRLAKQAARRTGFLNAQSLGIGSQNETKKTHRQCVEWVRSKRWIDFDDGFNYADVAKNVKLPPTLYFSAIADKSLGHPKDVRWFREESGIHQSEYVLLARRTGFKQDYDHINMLTHPVAPTDHFPLVLAWFSRVAHDEIG